MKYALDYLFTAHHLPTPGTLSEEQLRSHAPAICEATYCSTCTYHPSQHAGNHDECAFAMLCQLHGADPSDISCPDRLSPVTCLMCEYGDVSHRQRFLALFQQPRKCAFLEHVIATLLDLALPHHTVMDRLHAVLQCSMPACPPSSLFPGFHIQLGDTSSHSTALHCFTLQTGALSPGTGAT